MKSLPDKPSELIRLALKDLELCEKDPKYKIHMRHWHSYDGEVCYVCLAGAVMAKTLEYPIESNPAVSSQLQALDRFRLGDIKMGACYLGVTTQIAPYRDMVYYVEDKEKFKSQMRQLADDFEAEGN